ncbi:MAG: AtpZ/AtpI family protein [Lachnospiraceae bacterium]|nr:AtpZ/AtpI family protein [Lachnospiraceae bacterium]
MNENDREEKRKQMREALRHLTFLSQFGLSLVIPLLMCLFLCYWLTTRFGFGGWIYIPGFILGLGSSCMTAWKFYVSVNEKNRKNKKKDPPSFNQHY